MQWPPAVQLSRVQCHCWPAGRRRSGEVGVVRCQLKHANRFHIVSNAAQLTTDNWPEVLYSRLQVVLQHTPRCYFLSCIPTLQWRTSCRYFKPPSTNIDDVFMLVQNISSLCRLCFRRRVCRHMLEMEPTKHDNATILLPALCCIISCSINHVILSHQEFTVAFISKFMLFTFSSSTTSRASLNREHAVLLKPSNLWWMFDGYICIHYAAPPYSVRISAIYLLPFGNVWLGSVSVCNAWEAQCRIYEGWVRTLILF